MNFPLSSDIITVKGGVNVRLNSDCVRDILLTVEEACGFNQPMQYCADDNNYDRLKKYSHEEIAYHINQCKLSDLIINVITSDGGAFFMIGDLSPKGHQFLADIREDNIWNKVKTIACKIGSFSLSALMQISSNVISEQIKSQF